MTCVWDDEADAVESADEGRQLLVSYYSFCFLLDGAWWPCHNFFYLKYYDETAVIDDPYNEGYDCFEASFGNNFRIEAGYGCLIGSNAPAKGLQIMNRDITTDRYALDTIIQLFGDYSTAVAPS